MPITVVFHPFPLPLVFRHMQELMYIRVLLFQEKAHEFEVPLNELFPQVGLKLVSAPHVGRDSNDSSLFVKERKPQTLLLVRIVDVKNGIEDSEASIEEVVLVPVGYVRCLKCVHRAEKQFDGSIHLVRADTPHNSRNRHLDIFHRDIVEFVGC